MEHFYTIRYDTFLHIFLCSTTYQKLVFYAGIPLKCKKWATTLPQQCIAISFFLQNLLVTIQDWKVESFKKRW